jgi:hypothetical protein
MSTQNNHLFINKARVILDVILQTEPRTLRAAVACEALTYWGDDPREMFEDLACHGCQSGMINNLIFYADTHTFFDTHYREIDDLRDATEEEMGEPLTIRGDLKNALAWFAFEETALRMAREDLQLDI